MKQNKFEFPMKNHRRSHRRRGLIVLLIAIALVGLIEARRSPVAATETQSIVVIQTASAPMLTGTFQVVDAGPGHQTDPHVDCGMASYTNDDDMGSLTVRYYDFAANTVHPIPGNGANSLSDIHNGRVAFTEGTIGGSQIIVFDTATQTRTAVPHFGIRKSALGGNVVAYEERYIPTDPNQSDIGIWDLSLENGFIIAFPSLLNRNPAVSPAGDVTVWEGCQTDGTRCDIYSSTRFSSGSFVSRRLTVAAENRHPDTNGETAVYISSASGENDIYIQPVTGGTATQLSIPGNQRDVRISGNLISFESEIDGGYDVFVYDIASGNLYRVTNTPGNETLNDISVCNGVGRIVYAAPAADFDIFAFTFQPPNSTATDQLNDLIELVKSFDLPAGTESSLVDKLQAALAATNVSDTATACGSLTAFINEVQAQSGKKLPADQASQMINSANQIKAGLGCQ